MPVATTTLSWSHLLLLLVIIVGGMLLAGVVVIVGRRSVAGDQPGSVIRSWIAITLVMGLLVFCATAFLVDDASLRSTLFGGLIASVAGAVAFYFSSKSADQARADILNAATALAQGGVPPTGFLDVTPPSPAVGSL